MNENNRIMKKSFSCDTHHNPPEEGFIEMNQEDKEIYLFLRGGFAAK